MERSDREVIRCQHCQLNQFLTLNGCCRKCRTRLGPATIPPVEPVAEPKRLSRQMRNFSHERRIFDIGLAVWLVREALGVSQKQLAGRMDMWRSYISKVERGVATPTIEIVHRFAKAFGIPAEGLVQIAVLCGAERVT